MFYNSKLHHVVNDARVVRGRGFLVCLEMAGPKCYKTNQYTCIKFAQTKSDSLVRAENSTDLGVSTYMCIMHVLLNISC